jgi:NADPH:quinone reductase-like Zn-dependent oxidoreductase
MKAIRYHRYGSPDVLEYTDVETPVPGDDEVLVRVRAASVNPFDWHLMRGAPFLARLMAGMRRPKDPRLGADLAGVVEAVGKNVTQFGPGDEVFGAAKGAYAEYTCARGDKLAPKPANATFEQAAAIPIAGLTALQALRDKGHLQPGQSVPTSVLINGAAGGVGTFAVQIARAFGAEVTGVCSTKNVELVRSLGAAHVVDYTREDFTQSSRRYDVIVDCIGNHSLTACRRVMSRRGFYVVVGGPDGGWLSPLPFILRLLLLSRFVSQTLSLIMASLNPADLTVLKELIEAGKVTPHIDRTYPLSDAAEAIRYVETKHARGKVALTM